MKIRENALIPVGSALACLLIACSFSGAVAGSLWPGPSSTAGQTATVPAAATSAPAVTAFPALTPGPATTADTCPPVALESWKEKVLPVLEEANTDEHAVEGDVFGARAKASTYYDRAQTWIAILKESDPPPCAVPANQMMLQTAADWSQALMYLEQGNYPGMFTYFQRSAADVQQATPLLQAFFAGSSGPGG
ncbi:MAG: hypothetical protein ABSG98_09040 [Anaerolineales bacterium]|jgi:hypothetical protein